jgi:hypothetical protein
MAGSKEATHRPSYHAVGKEDILWPLTAKRFGVTCGNILGGTGKRLGPPGLYATGAVHGCPTTRLTCDIT